MVSPLDLESMSATPPGANVSDLPYATSDADYLDEKHFPHVDKEYPAQVEHGPEGKDAVELTPMEAFTRPVDGEESPFPEVQACVPTEDDPTIVINRQSIPQETGRPADPPSLVDFRMWFLLTVFVVLFAGVNQFFA